MRFKIGPKSKSSTTRRLGAPSTGEHRGELAGLLTTVWPGPITEEEEGWSPIVVDNSWTHISAGQLSHTLQTVVKVLMAMEPPRFRLKARKSV